MTGIFASVYSEMDGSSERVPRTIMDDDDLVCLFVCFFFYLGFLSQPFTTHRTAGEGGGDFFNSSLPLQPVSQTLRN